MSGGARNGGSAHGSDDQRFNALQLWIDQVGHQPYWTPDRIVARIQRWVREHDGRPPTRRQWSRRRRGYTIGVVFDRPSADHVVDVFGSWNAAIAAAGFTPRPRRSSGKKSCSHPLTPENVYRSKHGGRCCRRCAIERAKARYRARVPGAQNRETHVEVRASYPQIERMWLDGLLLREIAEELGVTVPLVASRMQAMRAAGWELPARSRGRRRST